MNPTNQRQRTGKTHKQKARSGAPRITQLDLGHHQFFLASVSLEKGEGTIHFLVSEEEGRSGPTISEIVLKCLLPSRHPSRWAGARESCATLRAIRPIDFVDACGAQIPCLGITGIGFWRLHE